MIRNYIKIGYRNLVKFKLYSFINIFGLAIGLTCFILISLFVMDELGYDKFNLNADRIYRINADIKFGGAEQQLAVSSDPFGAALKKDFDEVEQYTRIYANNSRRFIKKGTAFIAEENCLHADSTFFEIFSLKLLQGNYNTALISPNTLVISESTARKYFGNTNVIGKSLLVGINNQVSYTVTGVFGDMPQNSHFHANMIFSFKNINDYSFGTYLSHNFYTYIKLREGVNYKEFEKKLSIIVEKYVLPQAQTFMDVKNVKDFEKAGNYLHYSLIPLTDIHLKSDRLYELDTNGNIQYVYIFSAVAFFLLLIACINFMNLSTARSTNRAKEVGVRKVLGTQRNNLILQFMTESVLTSYLSFIFSLVFVFLLLPFFNEISGKLFSINSLFQNNYLIFLVLLPLVVGIVAGYYPSFYLSSYRPIEVLKSKLNSNFKSSFFRNSLVTFQFAISLILVISTFVVYQQLNYIQQKNLGFSKNQVLVVNGTASLGDKSKVFEEEVKNITGIRSATFAGFLPVANSSRSDMTFSTESTFTPENGFNMQAWSIDENYIHTLEMKLATGRNFSKEFSTDSSAVILNERAIAMIGFKDPIGKKLYSRGDTPNDVTMYTIVGVVKDFNYSSLKENIGPLCFRLGNEKWATAFKIETNDIQKMVKQVEAKWKILAPEMPFNYHFMSDSFDDMYQGEMRIGKIALIFAILTILLACLGLFGLITYMAEQRIKEIGIRKVLGASIWSVIQLLAKDFLKLVCLSFIIAAPLAYYAMHLWLNDFVYRINISIWIFIFSGLIALSLAIITVSYQAIKAALMNPVKSLKTE
jgi:putative ABC transport system permease protein